MIKISTVVSEIVGSSDFAVEGLRNGCLNLSAYAEIIRPEVEAAAKKNVTKSSIVIALSRLGKELARQPSLLPEFTLQNLSTTSGLFQAAFSVSPESKKRLMALQVDPAFRGDHFVNIAIGLSEVTIVAFASDQEYIMQEMKPRKPRSVIEGLGAIRVHVDKTTYDTPNILYSLLKVMSLSQINIESFTASFSELTFVVKEDDVKPAFLLFHDNFLGGQKRSVQI